MDGLNRKPRFAVVMPFWTDGLAHTAQYLIEAVNSIQRQSCEDWMLFIVDDCSNSECTRHLFSKINTSDSRIKLLRSDANRGPGHCRNIGVEQAFIHECDYVGFLDADDISPPNRVAEVIACFDDNPNVSVIYSGFQAMGPDGKKISSDGLIEGIKLLNRQLSLDPLEGYDIWKTILCERDGLTIPSSLNVKTDLARRVPFPQQYRFHEDTHTWVRYSAAGGCFKYVAGLEAKYRVLKGGKTSESRIRAGGIDLFNKLRCRVAVDSLSEAFSYPSLNGCVLSDDEKKDIREKMLLNLASIVEKEGSQDMLSYLRNEATKLELLPVDQSGV